MAFSYVLDFERPVVHRQESLTIINNFLITFCQDNRLTTSRLLPAGQDDSISDVDSGSIDTRGSNDQTPVHQLLTIFEHCGFFDHIKEIFNVESFVVPYRCALTALILNMAIVAPTYLLKKINSAQAWKLILDQLTGEDDMGLNSLNYGENTSPAYINFSIHQFHIVYDSMGFEIKSNLLQTLRLLEHDNDQTRNYLLSSTDYADCLMAQIEMHIGDGYYKGCHDHDLKIIGLACTLLGDVLRDFSLHYPAILGKLFSKKNAVANVISASHQLLCSKDREYSMAGCLFLAKLASINYGKVVDLGFDAFFADGGPGKQLGSLIVAKLIEILFSEYGTSDSMIMESVRICLQCLFGSCSWAKFVAVQENLPSKFMTRINNAKYLGQLARSEIVERDMFVVITLLRHLMAGSVELKVHDSRGYHYIAHLRQASSPGTAV